MFLKKIFSLKGPSSIKSIFLPIYGDDHKAAQNIIKSSVKSLSNLKKYRTEEELGHDPTADFDKLLEHWGITKSQLPVVIRNLSLQGYFFLIIAFFSAATTIYSIAFKGDLFPYIIYSLVIVPMGIFVFLARKWRVSVLRQKRFFSFKDWLLRRI